MRRLIPVVVFAVAMLMWGGCSVVAQHRAEAAAAAPWPLQLGGLRDVPARWPKRNASAAALALGPLEARVGIRLNRFDKRPVTDEERAFSIVKEPLNAWLDSPDTPVPAAVEAYLDSRETEIAAIRDHVIANEDAIAWPVDVSRGVDAPLPNLLAHMAVSRLLTANALRRASWDDLHACWILTRAVWWRPEVLSPLIAIATTRFVCAAACRLPAPAPAWFDEVTRFDFVTPMAAAQQADARAAFTLAVNSAFGATTFFQRALVVIGRPLLLLSAADLADRERAVVERFVPVRECRIDGAGFDQRTLANLPPMAVHARIAMPRWGGMWQRVARLRAEVELAQRVVILKSRGWPPSAPDLASSRCSDGSWSYANGELRFSRDIPVKSGAAFPLRYSR